MPRIYLSLAVIIGSASLIAVGSTGAFFSDTESSIGNTFAAGSIDLKVDNDSYYNKNRCTNVGTEEVPVWQWQGSAAFPVPGTACDTSFPLSDLDSGLLFFNFTDLKPDDEGEDTISLHVQNDAYACMDVSLTSNDDMSTTEPEGEVDEPEDVLNTWDGELAQSLEFFWWADDGDNVYEDGENALTNGVQTLEDLATTTPFSVALADATHNIWDPQNPGPIPANQTVYIGKAWCFGTLSLDPVEAGEGENPSVNPGVTCNGTALGNETQTDGATVDVAFRAVQARHNARFLCGGETPSLAHLTVIKNLVKDNGGNEVVSDFLLSVIGVGITNVTSGSSTQFAAGNYTVTETGVSGYQASFSGDCNASGQVTLNPGDNKTCTITNNDIPSSITLIKQVTNNSGGGAQPIQFTMRIDGNVVPQNASVPVSANSVHTITEDAFPNYSFLSVTGAGCPATIPGNVTLNEGESITCTITNDDNVAGPPPPLISDNFGTGTCLTDIPGWLEDAGESCINGTVAKNIDTGDDSVSPDGGRFALLGEQGYICRSVNASGLKDLVLKYYWRGDSAAEAGDVGSMHLYTGGTCASPIGEVASSTHALTSVVWSPLQVVNLPASLNNTSFLLKFTADTNAGNESFRIDGVSLIGTPI